MDATIRSSCNSSIQRLLLFIFHYYLMIIMIIPFWSSLSHFNNNSIYNNNKVPIIMVMAKSNNYNYNRCFGCNRHYRTQNNNDNDNNEWLLIHYNHNKILRHHCNWMKRRISCSNQHNQLQMITNTIQRGGDDSSSSSDTTVDMNNESIIMTKTTNYSNNSNQNEYIILSKPALGNPFHYAFPVHNLTLSKEFYNNVLGCVEGRSSTKWQDYSLYGHQIVLHWVGNDYRCQDYYNPVDGDEVPVPRKLIHYLILFLRFVLFFRFSIKK